MVTVVGKTALWLTSVNQSHRGLDFLVDDGTLDKDLLSVGLVDFHVVILGARLRYVAQWALLLVNLVIHTAEP